MTGPTPAAGPARVVVVGHGMVGSRFVSELVDRVPERVEVTVLGAEEYEPYNRVLLSEVVSGAVDVASLTLPTTSLDGVHVHAGSVVTAVDRATKTVTCADGAAFGYDHLVLATGARPYVPVVPGLAGTADADPDAPVLSVGIHALRTLDDAREIVAATVNARRAVVVGGGVLGVETACGLARRGLDVTIVHRGRNLMERQLDEAAGAAASTALAGLGIAHRMQIEVAEVIRRDGALTGVRLTGGELVPADLLVLTAGTAPRAALAAAAGLTVRRGVVVDETCTTADPAVTAIGDCAEPPEGATGLVAQGWDQARRLAARLAASLTGAPVPGTNAAEPGAPTDVVRLKAHDVDVITMGRCGDRSAGTPGGRAVRLSDPVGGRHVEVVVADGVVVGATCVGAGPVAADLVAAYTRRTPAPADPAQLLVRPARGSARAAEPSPTLMPDRATICRCNGVTKGDLVACWHDGARSVQDVAATTRATTGCGSCTDAVCGLLDWLRQTEGVEDVRERPGQRPRTDPVLPAPVGRRVPAAR